MLRTLRIVLLGLISVLAGVGMPAAALAATGAFVAAPVTAQGTQPQVAVDGAGAATALWTDTGVGGVVSATRTAGGVDFGTTTRLSTALVAAEAAAIASNRAGDVTAVWTEAVEVGVPAGGTTTEHQLLSASKAAGAAAFGTPIVIRSAGTGITEVSVAVDDVGSTIVSWADDAVDGGAYASIRAASAASWPEPQRLRLAGVEAGPTLASNAAGKAVLVWRSQDDDGAELTEAATRSVGSSEFQPPTRFTLRDSPQYSANVAAAVSPTGTAAIGWGEWDGSSLTTQLYTDVPGSGTFSQFCTTWLPPNLLALGFDAYGGLSIAGELPVTIEVSTAAPGRGCAIGAGNVPKTEGTIVRSASFAADDRGGLGFVWDASPPLSTSSVMHVAHRPGPTSPPPAPNSAFNGPVYPSNVFTPVDGFAPSARIGTSAVVADAAGHLTVTWADASKSPATSPGLAVIDRAPPSIQGVAPLTAVSEQPTTLTVAATDAYGAPLQAAWSSARRRDMEPGLSIVRTFTSKQTSFGGDVTVTDAFGNVAKKAFSGQVTTPSLPPAFPELFDATLAPTSFKAIAKGNPTVPKARTTLGKETKKRAARGSILRLNLTGADHVVLTVDSVHAGRKRGGTCKATNKPVARKRRCNALRPLPGTWRVDVAGDDSDVGFTGRWNGRRLAPGRYRLRITPVRSDGASGDPSQLAFRVLPRAAR